MGERMAQNAPVQGSAADIFKLAMIAVDEMLEAEDLGVFHDSTNKLATAVHCPCTLLHGQKRGGSLERILERDGIPLVETTEKHLCCGSAGTYSILERQRSLRLRDRKIAALTGDAPDLIATANIGCQLHLQEAASQPVRHWVELLDPKPAD